MSKQPVVKEFFRAIDDHDFSAVAKYHADTCQYRMNYDVMNGAEQFRQMIAGWYSAFPDLRHEVTDYVEEGNRAGFTLRITGTHTGTMRTPNGDVPATGKRVDFRVADIVSFGADGKAITWNAYFDMVVMLQQLGLAPAA
ncbi:MAG TPA: ester cyclase [Kofleriaceae bacterium]|jgi:steroid delta-isomerase-like uncharacterized protein|nr:ester cyclase [Kofleriaceae bacterium]